MYIVKTPAIVKTIFSELVWNIPTDEKEVFITFDDGPIPDITPWVLDLLGEYQFKATFFCVGDNVRKYPEIFDRILEEGHCVGNHTYNHLNGWSTSHEEFMQNIEKCDNAFYSNIFRPPYGKLKPSQSSALKNNKTIVMWDILSGDFDPNISKEKCLKNVIDNYKYGSVIVFHDNVKAEVNLKYVLPLFLDHLYENGFVSSSLKCLTHELEEV